MEQLLLRKQHLQSKMVLVHKPELLVMEMEINGQLVIRLVLLD
jgi:hypothetical protein